MFVGLRVSIDAHSLQVVELLAHSFEETLVHIIVETAEQDISGWRATNVIAVELQRRETKRPGRIVTSQAQTSAR